MQTRIDYLADVAYLGEERREKLDIYLPGYSNGSAKRPSVIVIHGGGWAKGDKAEIRQRDIADVLTRSGFVVFTINYRLTEFAGPILESEPIRSCWPDCLWDCREAVRYVRKNALTYHLDPARIFLFGLSAGGHLSLLAAATACGEGDISSMVSGVVYFYGIHDLRGLGGKWRFGEPSDDIADVREQASPINHIGKDFPPVFITHGALDEVIPISYSKDLERRLGELRVPYERRYLGNEGHGYGIHVGQDQLVKPVIDFLSRL